MWGHWPICLGSIAQMEFTLDMVILLFLRHQIQMFLIVTDAVYLKHTPKGCTRDRHSIRLIIVYLLGEVV